MTFSNWKGKKVKGKGGKRKEAISGTVFAREVLGPDRKSQKTPRQTTVPVPDCLAGMGGLAVCGR